MIATMPKAARKNVPDDQPEKIIRKGKVSSTDIKELMSAIEEVQRELKPLVARVERAGDEGLDVDGVGLGKRGVMQIGVFLDKVKLGLRRQGL